MCNIILRAARLSFQNSILYGEEITNFLIKESEDSTQLTPNIPSATNGQNPKPLQTDYPHNLFP
jgi:hypothetical protein